MQKKTTVLILTLEQFGYHIDTFYYCKHGRYCFDITYVGFDTGKPRLDIDGVRCIYVSRKGNVFIRYLRLLNVMLFECRKKYDIIFMKYFVSCSLVRILNPIKRIIMDIRTGSVVQKSINRYWRDLMLRFEAKRFKHITVISDALADKLRLAKHKTHILPLGAEALSDIPKRFDSMHLLYVGTLHGRQIEDTIKGLGRFYDEYGSQLDISYDIVGDGYSGEIDSMQKMVDEQALTDVVTLHGYIHQTELRHYYTHCNIGVCYIPITDYFDCQPATKTFEYLFAGMAIIATATKENEKLISLDNGVLIDSSSQAFYRGLVKLYKRKDRYCSRKIRQSYPEYAWGNIVLENWVPYINNIVGGM